MFVRMYMLFGRAENGDRKIGTERGTGKRGTDLNPRFPHWCVENDEKKTGERQETGLNGAQSVIPVFYFYIEVENGG